MGTWKLIIEDDTGKTIVVPVSRDIISIGRKDGNTIRLTERNVSRHHAKLHRHNGDLVIEDLKSYNGIKVNGNRISGRVEVGEGDLIEIGDYHLALQHEGAGKKPPPPPPPAALTTSLSEPIDDEFAGDTQRWDAPDDLSGLRGGMPTVQEHPSIAVPDEVDPQLDTAVGGEPLPGDGLDETVPLQVPVKASEPMPEFIDSGPIGDLDETRRETKPYFYETSEGPTPPAQMVRPDPAQVSVVSAADEEVMAPLPLADTDGSGNLEIPNMSGDAQNGSAVPDSGDNIRPALGASILTTDPNPAAQGPDPHQDNARLVIVNTALAGTVLLLEDGEQVIGRVDDNDIVVDHRSVSRHHARIIVNQQSVRIVDQESQNGVYLNGEDIEDASLRDDDEIELGRVRLKYVRAGRSFSLTPEQIQIAIAEDATDAEASGSKIEKAGSSPSPMIVGLVTVIVLLLIIVLALGIRVMKLPTSSSDIPVESATRGGVSPDIEELELQ